MAGISPIGPSLPSISSLSSPSSTGASGATGKVGGFGDAVAKGLDSVASLEKQADHAVASFSAGGPIQINEVMAATSKANLGMTIVNEIRNRGLEAYQQIINVQV